MKENPASSPALQNELELHIEGVRCVSLTFGMTLYTDQPLSKIAAAVLKLWASFQELVPASDLTFYATESMSVHKPTKKKADSLLRARLFPKSSTREYIVLELKGGEKFNAA